MEPFHQDFTSILIQIDSFEAQHIETDTRNGGIYDDLYPQLTVLISKKTLKTV
jgi:hypothetical protein